MPFEEYEPRGFKIDPIPDGMCSIDRGGNLAVRMSDLAMVNITDAATVLTDSTTMRIAIRKPRPGKKSLRVQKVTHKKNGPEWGKINLGGAIRQLDLEPEAVRGRYELMTKDDLIIIGVAEVPGDDKE